MAAAPAAYRITLVAITIDDCIAYEQLPTFPNSAHRDPFDRMNIAQALRSGLTIVGNDSAFDSYGIARLW